MLPMEPIRRTQRYASETEASLSDALMANMGETWTANPSVAAYRSFELLTAGGTKISHDDARQMVADAGLQGRLEISSVTTPTKEFTQILIDRKNDELKRLETIERAPDGAITQTAMFGSSFLTSLADPVNIAASFIPVAGEFRWAQQAARSSSALTRAVGRSAIGAVEGTVGAAILEPVIYASKRYEQAEYELMDSFLNIAFGGVFGAGLHTTAGSIGDVYRYRRGAEQPWQADARVARETAALDQAARVEEAKLQEPAKPAAIDKTIEIGPRSEAQKTADALSHQEVQEVYKAAVAQMMEGRDIDIDAHVAHLDQKMRDGTPVRELSKNDFEVKPDEIQTMMRQEIDRLNYKVGMPMPEKMEAAIQLRVKDMLEAQERLAKGEALEPIHIESMRQAKVAQAIEEGLPVPDRFIKGNEALAPIAARNRGKFIQSQIDAKRAQPETSPRSTGEKADVAETPKQKTALQELDDEVSALEKSVNEVSERLGIKEEPDADLKAMKEKAERWATIAEAAQLCVMRGG